MLLHGHVSWSYQLLYPHTHTHTHIHAYGTGWWGGSGSLRRRVRWGLLYRLIFLATTGSNWMKVYNRERHTLQHTATHCKTLQPIQAGIGWMYELEKETRNTLQATKAQIGWMYETERDRACNTLQQHTAATKGLSWMRVWNRWRKIRLLSRYERKRAKYDDLVVRDEKIRQFSKTTPE